MIAGPALVLQELNVIGDLRVGAGEEKVVGTPKTSQTTRGSSASAS